MVDNNDGSGLRLKHYLNQEQITQRAVAKHLGTMFQYINQICQGRKNVSKKMASQLQEGFGVSAGWLLTGEGTMYANQPEYEVTTVYEPTDEVERNLSPKGRPYYAVDFAAGFDILENDQTNTPSYYINFPPYNDCDCWCNARGNSMDPTISSGDLIAMKRIHDFRYLINGEIYGIVTSNGLRTIKRVRDNGQTLTLIPDNKEIPEQTIPKEIITNVFIIKGSIKQF